MSETRKDQLAVPNQHGMAWTALRPAALPMSQPTVMRKSAALVVGLAIAATGCGNSGTTKHSASAPTQAATSTSSGAPSASDSSPAIPSGVGVCADGAGDAIITRSDSFDIKPATTTPLDLSSVSGRVTPSEVVATYEQREPLSAADFSDAFWLLEFYKPQMAGKIGAVIATHTKTGWDIELSTGSGPQASRPHPIKATAVLSATTLTLTIPFASLPFNPRGLAFKAAAAVSKSLPNYNSTDTEDDCPNVDGATPVAPVPFG